MRVAAIFYQNYMTNDSFLLKFKHIYPFLLQCGLKIEWHTNPRQSVAGTQIGRICEDFLYFVKV